MMKIPRSQKLLRALPLVAVLAIAAAVRVALLVQLRHHPLFAFLRLDELEYDGYARDLLDYHWALPYVPIHAPGYNYVLAALYYLSNFSLLAPRVFNIVLGLASTVLVHRAARRLFGPGPALVSALLFGLYWPLIVFESRILAVSLYLFLCLAAFNLALVAPARGRAHWWALAGAACGLAIAVYPPAAPWPIVIAAWLAIRAFRLKTPRILVPALLVPAAAFLVIVPVIIHNYRVTGEWFLMQRNSGFNLFVGNNPDSDGSPYARPGSTWDRIDAMPSEAGIEAADQQDRFYVRKVIDFARNRPGAFILLQLRKCLMIVNRFEGRSTLDPAFQRKLFSVLSLPFPGYSVIMLLALPGILALKLRRPDHQLFVILTAVTAAVVVSTMVSSRYRMVFTALLTVLAGAGLIQLHAALISFLYRRPRAWPAPALAVLGIVLSILPVAARYNDAEEWAYLGDAYLSRVSRTKAAEYYRKARAEDPNNPGALMGLARIAMLGRNYTVAEELLRENAARNPESAAAWIKLGELYYSKGDYDQAVVFMEKAVKRRPQWVIGMYMLAQANASAGHLDRARELLAQIRALRPAFQPGDSFLEKIGEKPPDKNTP